MYGKLEATETTSIRPHIHSVYFSNSHTISRHFTHIFVPPTDQIDENLKITLQDDLTSMAPGLIIQVQ